MENMVKVCILCKYTTC